MRMHVWVRACMLPRVCVCVCTRVWFDICRFIRSTPGPKYIFAHRFCISCSKKCRRVEIHVFSVGMNWNDEEWTCMCERVCKHVHVFMYLPACVNVHLCVDVHECVFIYKDMHDPTVGICITCILHCRKYKQVTCVGCIVHVPHGMMYGNNAWEKDDTTSSSHLIVLSLTLHYIHFKHRKCVKKGRTTTLDPS